MRGQKAFDFQNAEPEVPPMEPLSIETLKDTQSERDHRRIGIDRVGVKNLRYPMQVRDKARKTQSTIANVALTVDLPHHYKGTHMSRFIEVLNERGPILHVDNIKGILRELLERLDSQQAHADFEFPFFLEKKAPVSGAAGLMDYTVRFNATLHKEEFDFVLTVIVPVTTLCPCSKAISAAGAHNQRGQVTYSIRFLKPIWIEDLIRLVESCASSELFSLLKRPDEKAVTERAYENPVFVEDLVRNIAARSNREPNITWYRVEAENFESIHNHNAYAQIEKG
jgi:GTP cyclohydrolase I